MADDADLAQPNIENMIADGMARAKRELDRRLIPVVIQDPETNERIGIFHNCESPISAGRLFCNKDCSSDWDDRMAARKRNGQ